MEVSSNQKWTEIDKEIRNSDVSLERVLEPQAIFREKKRLALRVDRTHGSLNFTLHLAENIKIIVQYQFISKFGKLLQTIENQLLLRSSLPEIIIEIYNHFRSFILNVSLGTPVAKISFRFFCLTIKIYPFNKTVVTLLVCGLN